ncbi:MAG: PilZ domain-containing protein [Deltaproteobacteria bacterium]|nr:PilZ domain-containing protein [Deltaproteobacteria bacterium]
MRLPEPDDRVELVVARAPNARFPCRVRAAHARRMTIALPMVAGEPMSVSSGEKIALRWRDEVLFIGAVCGTSHGGLLADLEVLEAIPCQRRGFFRWVVPLPVRFAVITPDSRRPWRLARTLDVSGGGLCVPWDEEVEPGTEMQLEMDIDGARVGALARVVLVRLNPQPPPSHLLSLEFVRISDADRSRIVRFIFTLQWSTRGRV